MRRQLPPLDQHSQNDGGGRERQAGADDQGGTIGKSSCLQCGPEDERRDQDLCRTQAEDIASECQYPLDRQLQSDPEQQEDHAQPGHAVGRLDVMDQAQPEGADQCTSQEVAQHRASSEAAENGNDRHRGDQDDEKLPQLNRVGHREPCVREWLGKVG